MSIRRDPFATQMQDRIDADVQAEKESRRYWVVTLIVCVGWCVLGALITGAGFALVLPPEDAQVLIDAGQGIAAAGVLATVTYAGYHRRARGLE
jgi:hypothetical protein